MNSLNGTGRPTRAIWQKQSPAARLKGMVAHLAAADTSFVTDSNSVEPEAEAGNHWRLVQRCQTLESALALMATLEHQGQSPRLVMADGLSVVTHRA